MYGFIYNTLRSLVVESHGEEAWRKICATGGVEGMDDGILDRHYYDEAILTKVGGAAAELLGVPLEQILEDFGGFFFKTIKRSGHSSLLRTLGHSLHGFLMNLDALHDHLSFTYPEMHAPSFRCEKTRTGLTLHYHSERVGLVHIVVGIVKAVAREFYELDVDIALDSYEVMDHLKHCHHYVLHIECPSGDSKAMERLMGEPCILEMDVQIMGSETDLSMERPTSVLLFHSALGNRSHSTGQVISEETMATPPSMPCPTLPNLPEDMTTSDSRVTSRVTSPTCSNPPSDYADIFLRQQLSSTSLGIHLPRPLLPSLSSRMHSRRGSAILLDPDWPITPHLFQNCFPFHIIFDRDLSIKHMGTSLLRLFPKAINEAAKLTDLFELVRPAIRLTYRNIRHSIHNSFIVSTKKSTFPAKNGVVRGSLQFRGQMVPTSMRDHTPILFLASPRINSIEELEEQGLYLSDIPLHDVSRDLILLNRHFRVEMRIARELEETKRDLQIEKAHVQEEKARADRLLHAMLPPSVTQELKSGAEASAMEYSSVTIMFSDLKGFTTICNQCKPMQVVGMLNELYTLFDSLIEIHNVYKVETIGDAYMVAAGLLDTSTDHAEAVTNMAFDMREEAGRVKKPTDNEPLQIRIGIHSGPVVAGVVGKKMPRYCLFGDTVNTASRMESHGESGRIHISEATYMLLQGKPYRFFSRGRIQVKGLGEKQTYFVEREYDDSDSQPDDDIEWDTTSNTGSDTFIRCPSFVKYHKIVPVTANEPFLSPPKTDSHPFMKIIPSEASAVPDDIIMMVPPRRESSIATPPEREDIPTAPGDVHTWPRNGHTPKISKHGRRKHKGKCHVS